MARAFEHSPHVMAPSSSELEVDDTHGWMIAGHGATGDGHRAGWPRVSPPPPTDRHNPPPPIACCHAISAAIPKFSRIPENYRILHDASWCPKSRRCGGAVAEFCPSTLPFEIYLVSIPMRVDNAYMAEVYTAWVALSARGPSTYPTFTF